MDLVPEVMTDVHASVAYYVERPRISLLFVVVALALGGGALWLHSYFSRWWSCKRVLIVGARGAGKSALFYRLRGQDFFWNTYTPTLSPVKINWEREKVSVKLVDLPGDPRLEHCMEDVLGRADLVIFMLDSVRFLEDIKDTAEKLWNVLGDPSANKRKTVPTLIVLNKCEKGQKMFPDRFVRHRLETEIDKVRRKKMEDVQEKSFEFTAVKSEVALARISVKNDHMTPVHAFLHKHLDATPYIY